MVREDAAVGVDDEARAFAALRQVALSLWLGRLVRAVEHVGALVAVASIPSPPFASLAGCVDVDDGRVYPVHHIGEVDERRCQPAGRADRAVLFGVGARVHRGGAIGPAREDGPDEKSHCGSEDEGNDGETPGHLGQASIIRARKAGSSSVSIPSFCAFSSLRPASSPATTTLVFLLTELETRAPSRSSTHVASSRVIDCNVPVKTTVLPASLPTGSAVGSGAWLSMFTPACFSLVTSA